MACMAMARSIAYLLQPYDRGRTRSSHFTLAQMLPPSLPSTPYTPYYCEENIYLLVQYFLSDRITRDLWDVYAVFISNPSKTVALWNQRNSRIDEGIDFVVWDYHVILVLDLKMRSTSNSAFEGKNTCLSNSATKSNLDINQINSNFPETRHASNNIICTRRSNSDSDNRDEARDLLTKDSSYSLTSSTAIGRKMDIDFVNDPMAHIDTECETQSTENEMVRRGDTAEPPARLLAMESDYGSAEIFKAKDTWVYDFDSRLTPPCRWRDYVFGTFPPHALSVFEAPKKYASLFRVVPGEDYLNMFASDRSHMLKEPSQLPSHLEDDDDQDHGKEKYTEDPEECNENLDVDEIINDLEDDKIAGLDSLGLATVAHSQPAPRLTTVGFQHEVKLNRWQEKLKEKYYAPPPLYPCIYGKKAQKNGVRNNLMSSFVSMSKEADSGGSNGVIALGLELHVKVALQGYFGLP